MNCSEFEEILHDLDRPGTEGFAAREAAFAHAEACARCTELLIQSEALDFALHTLAEQARREQASRPIEALLLNEFRRRNALPPRRMAGWQIAALGAAAALLVSVGVGLHHRTREKPNTTAKGVQVGLPQPVNVEHTGKAAPSPTPKEPSVADSAAESELETPFIALPYADDAMASEGDTVVRVTLSRAALASLGLPVTDVGASDRIPADIVLSEDGAPQAIRLVAREDQE